MLTTHLGSLFLIVDVYSNHVDAEKTVKEET